MRFKAVLFDFGDTLVETKEGIYPKLLRNLHESLKQNNINLSFEELQEAYFEVREKEHEIISKTFKEIDLR